MPGRLKVFFDGGCRPNPGRMEAAVVAAGRTLILPDLGEGDSAQAEWLALIEALKVAKSLGRGDFVLIGDSADVVAKATSAVPARGDAARHLERFRALAGPEPVRVRHVKRSRNPAGVALARARAC